MTWKIILMIALIVIIIIGFVVVDLKAFERYKEKNLTFEAQLVGQLYVVGVLVVDVLLFQFIDFPIELGNFVIIQVICFFIFCFNYRRLGNLLAKLMS